MTTSDMAEAIVTYPHITFSENCDVWTYGILLDGWHVRMYLTDGMTAEGAVEHHEGISMLRFHDEGELHYVLIDWSRVVRMIIV